MDEKKLTDDIEIDVGMIETSVLFDIKLNKEQYIWLLKGSIWKTYNLSKVLDLTHRLQDEIERLTEENAILKGNPPILAGRSLGKTIRAKLLAFDRMKEQNSELQKQVDECKEIFERRAVNNFAWEAGKIVAELENIKPTVRETYGGEEQVGVDIAINRIKMMVRSKGVEVE